MRCTYPDLRCLEDPDDLCDICSVCRAQLDKNAALAAWEGTPLDPDDDLSIIADYPHEVERLRGVQERIKSHPVYKLAVKSARRQSVLWAFDRGTEDEWFDTELCTCDGYYSDDTPRCSMCARRLALHEYQHARTQHLPFPPYTIEGAS